jgi:methionyl-tRNA formyltransferase
VTAPLNPSPAARVVLLGVPDRATAILANALRQQFGEVTVLLEQPVSRGELIRRRLRRLGAARVLGQVVFLTLVAPLLRRAASARLRAISIEHGFDDRLPAQTPTPFASLNSAEARAALGGLEPDVVVINGTRILDGQTLGSVAAPFINLHAGITPQYRGVHGGYWALVDGRPDLAGATVHLVDTGIDTGPVLAQRLINVTPADSYATYPLLQLAAGLPDLVDAVATALRHEPLQPVAMRDLHAPSRLRSHPTAREYLVNRLIKKVR